MNEKVLAAAVAAGLLAGAGFITIGISSSGVASAQEEPSDSSEENNVRPFHSHGAFLEDVLSGLVDDGTLDQSQADAIVEALNAKAEELRASALEVRSLIRQFLEDDVITAAELAQLPDIHPFNNLEGIFGDALADGQLTREELEEARPHQTHGRLWSGARLGALLDDGGVDQEEYDSLPEHHPLRGLDVSEYLSDGVISIDEFRELKMSQSDSGESA